MFRLATSLQPLYAENKACHLLPSISVVVPDVHMNRTYLVAFIAPVVQSGLYPVGTPALISCGCPTDIESNASSMGVDSDSQFQLTSGR